MQTTYLKTSLGLFRASFSERGLAGLDFPAERPSAGRRTAGARLAGAAQDWRGAAESTLRATLAGGTGRSGVPLDLSGGTTFQRQVWAALAAIPRGETRTYSQIAAAIGRPRAVRAVGRACGANPIPVLIPCHRVVAADGGLGGFSGGLKWKRWLLAHEGHERHASGV